MDIGSDVSMQAQVFNELIRFGTELLNAVDRRLQRDHGLSLSRFEPMQIIATTPARRVNDIAEALHITVGGTSKLVDRIEAAGLCCRRPNPDDQRSSVIELTQDGRHLLAAAPSTFETELTHHFVEALDANELHAFSSTLTRLRAAMAPTPHREDNP